MKYGHWYLVIFLSGLVFHPSFGLAQGTIGIYFDAPATTTNIDTTEPNGMAIGWLVLKETDIPGEVSGLRAHIKATTASGFPASVFWSFANGGQNFDVSPHFDVWFQSPLPPAAEIVLATMTAIVPDPAVETEFHLSAYRIPDILGPLDYPVYLPTFNHGPDHEIAPLIQASGNNYLAVATINGDGVDPGFPDITYHWQTDHGTGGLVGETLMGAFRYFTNDAARTLQAQIIPLGGLEIQAVGDLYSRHPVLHPYTHESVWAQLPVGASVSYQWRITPETPGPYVTGYQLVAGGQVLHERILEMVAHPTPCTYSGHVTNPYPLGHTIPTSWYPISPVDGIWEFGSANPGQTQIAAALGVRNLSHFSDLEIFPQISGSPAFRLETDETYPLILGHFDAHSVYVIFAPTTPGIHTATLDFGPAACHPMQLRGGQVVADTPEPIARGSGLVSIHPNPFNPITTVAFELAYPVRARLTVYDLQGRVIQRLADGHFAAGRVERTWQGTDGAGQRVSSGSYVVRLQYGEISESRTVTLLK